MIFSSRCLGLGMTLGTLLGGILPASAQSSSPPVTQVTRVRSTLGLGSQGAEVTELQSILQLLGFYLGRVDGVFSEATQQGVQRFQQAAGLPTTGQVTLVDWNRLLPSAGAQFSQSSPPPAAASPTAISPTAVNPTVVSPVVTPPSPSAQSFPIPEAAKQPPSGSVAPPGLPPSDTPTRESPPAASTSTQGTVAASSPEDSADSESVTFPVLRRGSEGTGVERLQQRLDALGFYTGEIDGVFGEETEESVKQFQAQFDLEIDGIVGSSTWEILFNTP